MRICETCKGAGEVPRKVWKDPQYPKDHKGPRRAYTGPAYRTIVRIACGDWNGLGIIPETPYEAGRLEGEIDGYENG